MTKPRCPSHIQGRRHIGLAGIVLAALICFAVVATGPATASAPVRKQPALKGPLLIPQAFRLPASNGYVLYVAGVPPREGRPGFVFVIALAKNQGVRYTAPATVTETSIQADLGALGEISLTFQRSGQPATAHCGRETISFDSGAYEGKIAFHGEEGYTDVEATTVPGNIDFWLQGVCGEGFIEGSFGSSRTRGARLYVRNPALGPELSVSKSKPGAAARISVSDSEYSNGIAIERFTGLRMPAGRFTYDRRLRSATLRPPAPFAGSATFNLGKKAGKRWSGDLTVDMPGRADLPLTGPALRAYLVPSE